MDIPSNAGLKEISPWYNEKTIPRTLLVAGVAPGGVWSKVVVESGMLEVVVNDGDATQTTSASPVVVPPGATLQVLPPVTSVRFHIHYFHPPRVNDGDNLASMIAR